MGVSEVLFDRYWVAELGSVLLTDHPVWGAMGIASLCFNNETRAFYNSWKDYFTSLLKCIGAATKQS